MSTEFLRKNSSIDSLSSFLVYVSLFLLYKKIYRSEHTEVFEREIQPHEPVKSLCESVVVVTPNLLNSVTSNDF